MSEKPLEDLVPDEEISVHVGEPDSKGRRVTPWSWVPSVYFAQGLQYVLVLQLFAIIFFTMGVPQGDTLFWVGLLSAPWVLKPLWGPLVDKYWSKRRWTWVMQLCVGIGFVGATFAIMIPGSEAFAPDGLIGGYLKLSSPAFLYGCIIFLAVIAIAGATHDIACDGYYMLGLNEKQQAFYVGVRSTLFRVAMIFANGILIWIAGSVQSHTGLDPVEAKILVGPVGQPAPIVEQIERPSLTGDEGQYIIVTPPILTTIAGEVTTFTVTLAQAPPVDEEQIVIFEFVGGDKSISVSQENSRLIFTQDNWDSGVPVPVKSDEKIRKNVEARFKANAGNFPLSWAVVTGICAIMFLIISMWHKFILPYPEVDKPDTEGRPPFYVPFFALLATLIVPILVVVTIKLGLDHFREQLMVHFIGQEPTDLQTKGFGFLFTATKWVLVCLIASFLMFVPPIRALAKAFFYKMSDISQIGFAEIFETFFTKSGMAITLGFLLTFRLGEAQLAQVKNLFLLDKIDKGGLAMSLGEVAFTNSVVYLIALLCGGLLGGLLIAKTGLKNIIWYMVAAMHLPNLLYFYLSYTQPESLIPVNCVVAFESFGYGFGFAAYLMVMILAAQGSYKTAHYALCTGAMALGYMLPGMWSGYLQEVVGYNVFFIMVMFFTLPGIFFIPFLKIDPNFGKKGHTV
jgi:MFS transporter, PAT family, beta-lactamase induction signal transducer AmpG